MHFYSSTDTFTWCYFNSALQKSIRKRQHLYAASCSFLTCLGVDFKRRLHCWNWIVRLNSLRTWDFLWNEDNTLLFTFPPHSQTKIWANPMNSRGGVRENTDIHTETLTAIGIYIYISKVLMQFSLISFQLIISILAWVLMKRFAILITLNVIWVEKNA